MLPEPFPSSAAEEETAESPGGRRESEELEVSGLSET